MKCKIAAYHFRLPLAKVMCSGTPLHESAFMNKGTKEYILQKKFKKYFSVRQAFLQLHKAHHLRFFSGKNF